MVTCEHEWQGAQGAAQPKRKRGVQKTGHKQLAAAAAAGGAAGGAAGNSAGGAPGGSSAAVPRQRPKTTAEKLFQRGWQQSSSIFI